MVHFPLSARRVASLGVTPFSRPARHVAVVVAVAAFALGACASAEEPVVLIDSIPASIALDSSVPAVPAATDAPAVTDGSGEPSTPETAPASGADSTAAAAASTVAAGQTDGPSEVSPPASGATGPLDASIDGLGEARFGDDAQDVIGYFAEQFGPPTDDTGWRANESPCDQMGTRQRRLSWNDAALIILSTGPTEMVQRGTDHFSAFVIYSSFPGADRITVNGVTVLGRSVADLQAEIPGVTSFDSEIEGPMWAVGSDAIGGVAGSASEGVTGSVRAGLFCID
jgi:hypothetical protein